MANIPADTAAALTRTQAVFHPADPPRTSTIAFIGTFDVGDPAELTLFTPTTPDGTPRPNRGSDRPSLPGYRDSDLVNRARSQPVHNSGGVELTTVAVTKLSVADAVPVLSRARRDGSADPAAAFWGAAVVLALHLVARGRIVPALSAGGADAWRAGPLDGDDVARVRELAAAMPASARALPVTGDRLPDAEALVRQFLDAVVDGMPRTAAAVKVAGGPLYAARAVHKAPRLRAWADEVAGGLDAGLRVSLRAEVPGGDYATGAFHAVVQAHSLADPSVVVDAAQVWAGTDLGRNARVEVTRALRRASREWPPLARLLGSPVPDRLVLDDAEIDELMAAAPRLAAAGVDVHWPRELLGGLTSRVAVGRAAGGLASSVGLDWRIAVGGRTLTPEELDRVADAHRPVVRLRDGWVLVDAETLRRARERELKPVDGLAALGMALTGSVEVDGETVDVEPAAWLDELRARIADPDSGAEDVDAPPGLAATLRDYQLRGLRWLVRMTSLGLGACLADDMGLGKTITLIALHLHRASGPTLVVCPASLLSNWEREIRRFAPGVPVRRFHGAARDLADEGFVLTTYGTLRADLDRLSGHQWDLVVADEAQHAKNPTSATAKALRALKSTARVALTGTPVENNLSELWSILDWTTPGLLGSQASFRARWAERIEGDRDPVVARRFARLITPFLLRRRKSDPGIAPELPPKTETDQPVPLSAEQAGLYTALVRETMAEIGSAHGMARRGLVMKLITGLKQICNHPAHYLKDASGRLAGRSGKLDLLDELVDTIRAEDGAVLVFTQYVAMARLIERRMRERGVPTGFLHGGTPVPRREELVAAFGRGEFGVFLLSLKAAGTGLNLTRADHVVHFDRWWNPAVEDQATDRAYRIGQTRPVQVHRLIAEGTLEDRIAALLAGKRDLAESVLSSGEAAFTELSDADLAALVELRGGA
ncbi:helicase SNF2 [Actinokineospora fastidiosa]|uniref:Helicase SNF2 n=1 Tax=Actinokineospora fastidiosa TaxID=1816 RepID=A0A918GNK5_9PSEU|nr:helicase SNF2 [Actinokineospora fastidiosa]